MTRVMLDQSAVPMFLSTVHDHVRPISGNGYHGGGPVAPCLARGLYVSPGRGESVPRGSSDPVRTM
jgi:hypothetical protein